MADDNSQRPYRSSGAAGGTPAGNDPLAELARLIGQNDPFSEFGRDGARRAAAPRSADPNSLPLPEPAADWPPQTQPAPEAAALPLGATPPAEQPLFGSPGFGRQPFGGDLYQVDHEVPGYGAAAVPGYPPPPADADYEHDPYAQPEQPEGFPELGAAHDDFYEDEPPNRRRLGILAIAAVFALAVIGTAGAFGYRAIFGSSSTSGPPPVIKADTTPSKIVPATAGKDAQASKAITDRVNARSEGEKLVSREEEPVTITPVRPANATPGQGAPSVLQPSGLPQLGSGIVGAEPKKIRTIPIRPDQSSGAAAASPAPEPAEPAAQPAPRVVTTAPARPATPPPQPQPQQRAAEPPPAPAPVARAAPVQPPANAPLSLNPNAAPPAARTAAVAPPTRLAPQPAAPAATASNGGGYAVQVSSQRSEADAQAAFRTLQGKYPDVLGGRAPLIKRVDLGSKGIYFRAMVGPFGSSGEASELCSSLKSAGGSCLIQRN